MQLDVRTLNFAEADAQIEALADVLIACVDGGASVSFMAPMPRSEATAFWQGVTRAVKSGNTILVAAFADGVLCGTGQLGVDMPPNQPHRADVKKMLVHPAWRNHGVGAAVMRQLEAEARRNNRSLLVLDTASAAAERLYERAGFVRAGVIPDYALLPHGGFCDTVLYYKALA